MVEQKSESLSNEDNLKNLVEEHFAYLSEKNPLSDLMDDLMDIVRDKKGKRIREIAEISGIGGTEGVEEIFHTVFKDAFMMSTSRDGAHKKLGIAYEGTDDKRLKLASIALNTLWDIREKMVDQALNQS